MGVSAVVPLRAQGTNQTSLESAIEDFLASVELAESTIVVYRATLQALVDDLESDIALVKVGRATLDRHLRGRYATAAPATFNRNLATISSMMAWAEENELVVRSAARGLRRRKPKLTVEAERQQRPIALDDLETLWSNHRQHSLRDRTFWAMAYDTAARADELLGLDIERIDQQNREAVIIGKGGNAERLYKALQSRTHTASDPASRLAAGLTRPPELTRAGV